MVPYSCVTCIWFDHEHESLKEVGNSWGYCRKHHPIVYQKEGRYYGGWPLVDLYDLCGEYRKEGV